MRQMNESEATTARVGVIGVIILVLIIAIATFNIMSIPNDHPVNERLDKIEKRVEQLIDLEYSRSLNRMSRELQEAK